MWRSVVSVNFFFAVLLSFLLSLPLSAESHSVVFTAEQLTEIKSELSAMRSETNLLRNLLSESEADSMALKQKCSALEEKLIQSESRLMEASQDLASSGKTLIELRKEVGTLRQLLEELRAEFAALNKSYSRQKKKTSFWRTAAIISILAAITEGGIIWLSK